MVLIKRTLLHLLLCAGGSAKLLKELFDEYHARLVTPWLIKLVCQLENVGALFSEYAPCVLLLGE